MQHEIEMEKLLQLWGELARSSSAFFDKQARADKARAILARLRRRRSGTAILLVWAGKEKLRLAAAGPHAARKPSEHEPLPLVAFHRLAVRPGALRGAYMIEYGPMLYLVLCGMAEQIASLPPAPKWLRPIGEDELADLLQGLMGPGERAGCYCLTPQGMRARAEELHWEDVLSLMLAGREEPDAALANIMKNKPLLFIGSLPLAASEDQGLTYSYYLRFLLTSGRIRGTHLSRLREASWLAQDLRDRIG